MLEKPTSGKWRWSRIELVDSVNAERQFRTKRTKTANCATIATQLLQGVGERFRSNKVFAPRAVAGRRRMAKGAKRALSRIAKRTEKHRLNYTAHAKHLDCASNAEKPKLKAAA